METLLQRKDLIKRAYWLVRMRWAAVALLFGGTFVAANLLNIALPAFKLYVCSFALLAYNITLYNSANFFTRGSRKVSEGTVSAIIKLQIVVDLFILAIVLHYSGGIENPFYLFFVFHLILSSIILSARESYFVATLDVVLFSALIKMEAVGIFPHYWLRGFTSPELYKNTNYIYGTLTAFVITLYLAVYMTTSISRQLRRQQDKYEESNRLLKEKDHMKNEYVLRVTHDIKGHLAAIQSCLEIVIKRMVGPLNEKQADLIERASGRAVKCLAFVNALLRLTRMKLLGRLDMHNFSIKNAVLSAVAFVESRAVKKSIKLEYEIESTVDDIYGESASIEETITDLLLNAIKYTPDNGAVKISLKDEGETVLIVIKDTGIGIPEEELGRIFEEFYRASNARKVERDGTGLGLSIVKQVAERHGGTIWAQNNKEGGATFSFRLPKRGVELVSHNAQVPAGE